MVIARVVNGAMQIIGHLKQRVHLANGLGENNKLSEEAMEQGLNCLSLFAERLQGFSPSSVCIVAPTRYAKHKMLLIFSNVRKRLFPTR